MGLWPNGGWLDSLVLGSVVLLLSYICISYWRNRKYALPGLGTLQFFPYRNEFPADKIYSKLMEFGKRYNGIFRFANIIIVDNKDVARELYVDKDPAFTGKPGQNECFLHDYFYGSQDIAFRSYGEKWKFLRKQAIKALHAYGSGLQHFELIVTEELADLGTQLEATQQKDVDPSPLMYGAIANIITSLMFGEKFSYDSQEVRILKEMDETMLEACYIGLAPELVLNSWARWFLWVPLPRYRKKWALEQRAFKHRDEAFDIIKKYKDDFHEATIQGALGHLLMTQRECGAQSFTDEMLVTVVLDMVMGGTATTHSAITGLLFGLVNNPKIQSRARKEVYDVIGDSRPPRLEDKEKMPYLNALILDQLRLQSVLGLGLYRCAMQDTELAGYTIRKGSTLMVNHWALHHDPEQWENPDHLHPEHFLDGDGQLLPTDVYKNKGYIPFGAGRRACFGEVLAKTRFFLVVASLLQRFEFCPPEDSILPKCNSSAYVGKGLVVAPPFKMRFVPILK